MNCRVFSASAAACVANRHRSLAAPLSLPMGKADFSLRIEPCELEISPGVKIQTIACNAQVGNKFLRRLLKDVINIRLWLHAAYPL
jgi:hypothetical protein